MPSAAVRDAAIDMVLGEVLGGGGRFWRLGVRVFPTTTAAQSYRKMLSLVHPDKNQNSPRSAEATRQLIELWEDLTGADMPAAWWDNMLLNTRSLPMNSFELKLKILLENEAAASFAPARFGYIVDPASSEGILGGSEGILDPASSEGRFSSEGILGGSEGILGGSEGILGGSKGILGTTRPGSRGR